MIDNDTFAYIEKALGNYASEHATIVKIFDKATMNTEHLAEEEKMKIRMDALEVRCKNSQLLLEKIITTLRIKSKELVQIKQYEDRVVRLLSDIRKELNNNNLLLIIKHLETISVIMSAIHQDIKAQIKSTPEIFH